jgi:hypothetical protein
LKTTILNSFIFTLFCTSCAQVVVNPDYKQVLKMDRVENKDVLSSGMPNYYLPEMKEQLVTSGLHRRNLQVSRSIASVDESTKEMNSRELYFYNLYAQYRFFKMTLKVEKDDLKVCPQFHHSMMTQQPLLSRPILPVDLSLKNLDELKQNPNMIVLFPEMALPVEHDDHKTIVFDKIMGGAEYATAVHSGLMVQYEKTVTELKVICDRGVSDNFYVFTNFINFIKSNPEYIDRPDSLKALLKMPVFSNHYLISFLNYNSEIDHKNYTRVYSDIGSSVFETVKMTWVPQMVENMGQKRKKLNGYFSFNN